MKRENGTIGKERYVMTWNVHKEEEAEKGEWMGAKKYWRRDEMRHTR
jgi:hypothetical protein